MLVKTDSPVTTEDLLAKSIKRMRWGGVSPKNRTKITVAYGTTMLIINFITFILLGVNLIVNNYEDKIKFMYDVTLFIGYWQIVIKCSTLLLKDKAMLKLININNTEFWTLDTNVLTKDEKQNIQSIYNKAKIAIEIYFNIVILAPCGHYVYSYWSGKTNLVLNIWMPKSVQDIIYSSPGYEIFFIIQMIIMSISDTVFLFECDSIFIFFLASVVGQIRILKFRLNLIGNKFSAEENILNLAENIKQHNIIFESDMWMYIIFLPYVGVQIFIFCLIGQYIQDETLSVAEAAYKCNWEDVPNKKLHFMIMMIIARAQKPVNITMGGIIILSLETFTGISRTLLSFLTFMLNIQK